MVEKSLPKAAAFRKCSLRRVLVYSLTMHTVQGCAMPGRRDGKERAHGVSGAFAKGWGG